MPYVLNFLLKKIWQMRKLSLLKIIFFENESDNFRFKLPKQTKSSVTGLTDAAGTAMELALFFRRFFVPVRDPILTGEALRPSPTSTSATSMNSDVVPSGKTTSS